MKKTFTNPKKEEYRRLFQLKKKHTYFFLFFILIAFCKQSSSNFIKQRLKMKYIYIFICFCFLNTVKVYSQATTCGAATTLVSGVATAGTNAGGVAATIAATCEGGGTENEVWYKITIGGSGSIAVNLAYTTINHAGVSLYSGACGSLTEIGCNPNRNGPATIAAVGCLSAGTYYIRVWNYQNDPGTFNITATYAAGSGPPTNDACSGATPLVSGVATPGTGVCATTGTGGVADPTPTACGYDGAGVNNTVWYTYTTGATGGNLTVSVAPGGITYAALSIFSGTCGSFTQIGCSDPNSPGAAPSATVTCLSPSTTYHIMVWDDGGTAGTFTITPTFAATACSGTPTGGTAAATVTSGCTGYVSTISVSGNSTGCGISYQWYSSPDNSTWTIIAGATSTTYAATVSSSTYYHCVTTCSNGGASAASSSILCSVTPPPSNDNCSGAISLGSVSTTTTITGNNTCATADLDPADPYTANENIWYSFTVPASGGTYAFSVTTITLTKPNFAVVQFATTCNSTGAVSTASATSNGTSAGTVISKTVTCMSTGTYYIMVDNGSSGTDGTFSLTVTQTAPGCSGTPTAGTATASATSGCAGFTSTLGLTGASTTCGLTYQWYSSPDNSTWTIIAGATSATYAATVAANTYYHCVITCPNGGATGTSGSVSCTVTPVPSNDLCAGATTLNSGVTIVADNTCAGSTGDPPSGGALEMCSIDGGSTENTGSLWYTYTPSVNGTMILTVETGTMSWPMINMYSGSCASLGGHSCAIYSAFDAGIISITQCLTAGTTYYFLVSDDNDYGNVGTFSLTPAFISNDACSNAQVAGVVTSAGYNIQGDNSCASKNTGGVTDPSPSCANTYSNNTVWYTFTTPNYSANYTVTAVPSGGTYGATYLGLGVFSGSCGSFTQQGCSFPAASTGIPTVVLSCLPANTTYYVMIYSDTHNGQGGGYYFNIASPACSAGNAAATTTSKCSAGTYTTSLSLANTGGCITNYQWQSSTNNSTWSNIVGATSATYTATISSNIYYQCIVTCSDGSTLTSSSEYCSTPNTPPINDACANAIGLTFNPGINLGDYLATIVGDNSCATADGASSCFTPAKSVWYKFTAPVTGSYNVMIASGTIQFPELSIKAANTTCASFTEVSCAGGDNTFTNIYESVGEQCCSHGSYYQQTSDNSLNGYSSYSQINQYYSESGICNLTAGQTVYIMVDNNATGNTGTGTAGTFTLTVGTLENDNIPNGVVVNNCGSVFNSSTIGATNCGNGSGGGLYGDLDNNTSSNYYGSGADVGYSVENDSWYQFCTTSEATVTVNFQPVTSSCLPSASGGGSSALQISIYTGTSSYLSSHVAGGTAGMDITTTQVYTYPMAANQCSFIEVDGFAGTNCNYQLAITMTPGCVLPVDILSFSGILTDDLKAKLNWVTASEVNSDHYLIERSTDGIDYTTVVGTVKAMGNSTSQTSYELYDTNPFKGTNYYKLTEFDKNGLGNFLGYATVNNRASLPLLNLYPNPAQNSITLSLKNFATSVVTYELYNAQGSLLQTNTINLVDGNQTYKIDLSNLTNGFYFVKLNTGDDLLKKTFVKTQ